MFCESIQYQQNVKSGASRLPALLDSALPEPDGLEVRMADPPVPKMRPQHAALSAAAHAPRPAPSAAGTSLCRGG